MRKRWEGEGSMAAVAIIHLTPVRNIVNTGLQVELIVYG